MDKVLLSLKNAFFGLKYCFSTQRNMVIHVVIGSFVLISALVLAVSLTEILFLLTAIFLVLISETLNTALEKGIDLYVQQRNKLAHIAKDIAAGAVLLTSIFAVLVGLLILGPPLWQLF